jgi:kynurenine 3-monooxygenase
MTKEVTIIGAGLAGSLLAVMLARRGFQVQAIERRPDPRQGPVEGGRSINLALSTRGIHALRQVGLVDEIMKVAIPMQGRMIHPLSGPLNLQRYGKDDSEVIYAISRAHLNLTLLSAAAAHPEVALQFDTRLTAMDFHAGEILLWDEASGREYARPPGTVIGTDGSASALRLSLQQTGRFNLSQQYLDYGYKELTLPAGPGGTFLLEKNALHIWPRGSYMLIALPNIGGTYTCTFFFPFEGPLSFASLDSRERVKSFFTEQFPDAVALMPDLLEEYHAHPTGVMVTIKCEPWHYQDRMALLGDAAHAIVPFFGQGMNCAFEDCTVLDACLEHAAAEPGTSQPLDWQKIFREYESARKPNTDAIADLAIENFVEMRDLVAQPKFQLKKKIEQALQARYPDIFVPKYSMVTFHRIPYAVALERGRVQDRILDELADGIDRSEDLDYSMAERLVRRLPPLTRLPVR